MALEQFDPSGQVAIVTGAGKGVGPGIARVLAEAGATVVGRRPVRAGRHPDRQRRRIDLCVYAGLSLVTRAESVTVKEIFDYGNYDSHEYTCTTMGFGTSPGDDRRWHSCPGWSLMW